MAKVDFDKKIDELLLNIHRDELERDERRYREETAGCPTWARAEALALDPSAATDAERGHLRSCPRCATRMNSFQSLIHPPLLDIVRHELGALDGDAAREVEHHLRAEQCWQCQRLPATRMVTSLVSAVRGGARSLEGLSAFVAGLLRGADYVPALAGLYAQGDVRRAPYTARFEQGTLSVLLEEQAGDTLLIHVETQQPTLEGETISVEVAGESDSLTAEVVLRRHGDLLVGRRYIPGFGRLRAGLKRILVLAAPRDAGPDPARDQQTP